MSDPMSDQATSVTDPTDRGTGIGAYVLSLVVGLPNIALMLYLAYDGVLVRLVLALTAMSALGCILAVVGMRHSPRRFRLAALLLTLIPGVVIIAGTAIFVVFLVALIQAMTPQ